MRNLSSKLTVLLLAGLLPFARCEPAFATNSVLVLYANSRLVPGNVEIDQGISAELMGVGDRSVRIHSEFLDHPEFSGDAYDNLFVEYLHGKYSTSPPDAIIAVSDQALGFVIRHRAQLFPRTPVIHTAGSTAFQRTLQPMPADIVGVPTDYDYAGTIVQALRWHPNARHLVVITGESSLEPALEAQLRSDESAIVHRVTREFWPPLPIAVLQDRLGRLGLDVVVFTTGFFQDGAGKTFIPRDVVALIARASPAPVYAPFDTVIGTGIVGGRMPSYEEMGRQAGQTVKAILAGAAPDTLRLPNSSPMTLHIDWRQAQRWGIDAKMLPAGTVVHFKQPTFWEAYRTGTIIVVAVFVLQTVFITALFLERRRRSAAESTARELNTQLAHASRLAVAGELTAAIAHEINQPLGSAQTSADAADLILHSGPERREDLIRIVTRIRGDIGRASDVIRRLRTLLAKHEPERRAFDAGVAMSEVAMILRPEAERRKVTLETRPPSTPLHIAGDQTQIQQVLINLVLNAMDAAVGLPENRRHVEVSMERNAANILMTVRDRGQGIPPEDLPKLFDSFFSTKQGGMGLGLSIARSIVEAHGGHIWAESREIGGTTFHVELPVPTAGAVQVPDPLYTSHS
jgi:signal transduction histidine kinase